MLQSIYVKMICDGVFKVMGVHLYIYFFFCFQLTQLFCCLIANDLKIVVKSV